MSVVVVTKDENLITLVADTQETMGDIKLKNHCTKVFSHNSMMIGALGLSETCNLFCIFTKTTKPKSNEEIDIIDFMIDFKDYLRKKEAQNDAQFVMLYHHKPFSIMDLYVQEITTFTAVGAGRDIALGVLYITGDATKAVKAACHLNLYCEEPITVLTKSIENG